jgi:hypothetical protein
MIEPTKVVRRQLQLPLENMRVHPHPIEQMRREVIDALADLLREALGAEAADQSREQGVGNEPEDYA